MGACLSFHKDPDSAVEPHSSVGPNLLTESTVKREVDTVNGSDPTIADVAIKSGFSSRFLDAGGSKDDAFFDSQPWLESDGEDEFLSINGDFTPSRGSTPLHHKFLPGNQTVNNASVLEEAFGQVHEPPHKMKRLSELFKESLRHQNYTDYENEDDSKNVKPEESTPLNQSKSTNEIDAKSTDDSEKTPNRVKPAQCCLPRFSERRKKTSPVIGTG